ncbi:MAG: PIG-L family deacetylase [Clostridia bacterium]|nr:PIG-L family deacetylase [Clostridia bacterium]
MKRMTLLVMLALLLLLPCMALGEMAEDITNECVINNQTYNSVTPDKMRDNSYRSIYEGSAVTISAPAGKTIGSVLLKWRTISPPEVIIKTQQGSKWIEVKRDGPNYAAQYITLDEPLASLRISPKSGSMQISEITVLTEGEAPDYVQVWKDAPEKVDMMLFSTHPDDEVLWFGGLLPLYEGELGKDVLVVNAVYSDYVRRLELLDALWTCGVDIYPVLLGYPNQSNSMNQIMKVWRQKGRDPENRTVELLRQYKPDVVVLHDIDGEYGHTAHVTFSWLGRQAVERAGNAAEHAASAKKWGVWEVPKTYIHLYSQNQIKMDWSQPLSAFDGKTGIEVATIALDCHISQLNIGWRMDRAHEYDNTLFGLWRTNVGPDVEKNDMFENIPEN